MSEHTPTPWRVDGHSCRPRNDKPKGSRLVSDRGDGFTFHIAAVGAHPGINAEQARANAAFIVKAVNAHDMLVNALQDILDKHAGLGVSPEIVRAQAVMNALLIAPRHT